MRRRIDRDHARAAAGDRAPARASAARRPHRAASAAREPHAIARDSATRRIASPSPVADIAQVAIGPRAGAGDRRVADAPRSLADDAAGRGRRREPARAIARDRADRPALALVAMLAREAIAQPRARTLGDQRARRRRRRCRPPPRTASAAGPASSTCSPRIEHRARERDRAAEIGHRGRPRRRAASCPSITARVGLDGAVARQHRAACRR